MVLLIESDHYETSAKSSTKVLVADVLVLRLIIILEVSLSLLIVDRITVHFVH